MARKFKFGAIPSNYIPLILYVIVTAVYLIFFNRECPVLKPFSSSWEYSSSWKYIIPGETPTVSTFKQFNKSLDYYQPFTIPPGITSINILCVGGGGTGGTAGGTSSSIDDINGNDGDSSYFMDSTLQTIYCIAYFGKGGKATGAGGLGGGVVVPEAKYGTSRGSRVGNAGNAGITNSSTVIGGSGGSVGNITGKNVPNIENIYKFGKPGSSYISTVPQSSSDDFKYGYSKAGVKLSLYRGYGGGGVNGGGGGGGGAVTYINGFTVTPGQIYGVIVGGGGINGGDGAVIISWGSSQGFSS